MRLLPGILASFYLAGTAQGSSSVTVGNIRIQSIGESCVRIELQGPNGFEDRPTFAVVGRKLSDKLRKVSDSEVRYGSFTIQLPGRTKSLSGVSVRARGKTVYTFTGTESASRFLPFPGDSWIVHVLADAPRLVPPSYGATPAPQAERLSSTSGWDTRNSSPDVYLFLNKGQGYRALVKDYLGLTGKIEMPPLYLFGLIDSRYFPYTQESALATIKKYRDRGFPLDMFVLDTDWRVNASKGYEVNKKLWPSLTGFTEACRVLGVRTMINDHPEAQAAKALDPSETKFRWNGLTSLLNQGIDVLWYDRNWITKLLEPMPGISKEAWGQRVYHDVTQRFRPDERPLILSNVDGIDNGVRNKAPHPGFHRYPFMWTGDTAAQWSYLDLGVRNAVNAGLDSLLPYMSEDLTGHTGKPTPELYVRFMQYGCLSPVTRIHCAAGQTRFPWDYGEQAEDIVRDFVRLRYRLLPMLYTAARRAYDEGVPLLRRCDWEWPQYAEANDATQYLLGDDLLVAPILEPQDATEEELPANLWAGLKREGFSSNPPVGAPLESISAAGLVIEPEATGTSYRWSGTIGPIQETGDHVIGISSTTPARLFVEGQVVLNATRPGRLFKVVKWEAGKSYTVVLETGRGECRLLWTPPSRRASAASRRVWIPPGVWRDVFTGESHKGPRTVTVTCGLERIPLFVREGSVVWTSGPVASTAEGVFSNLGLDVWIPSSDGRVTRSLYEDDGHSLGYAQGDCSTTDAILLRKGRRITLTISRVKGARTPVDRKSYRLRFHCPKGMRIETLEIDGQRVAYDLIEKASPGTSDLFSIDQKPTIQVQVGDPRKVHRIEVQLASAG